MNQETIIQVLSLQKENSSVLQILSNDIRKTVLEDDEEDEEEELNSSNSASLLSEDSSEWDNWDDDGDVDINTNIKEVVRLLEKLSEEFADEETLR